MHTHPSKRQAMQVVTVRFLDKTAAALYQDFTHENPTMPISKSQYDRSKGSRWKECRVVGARGAKDLVALRPPSPSTRIRTRQARLVVWMVSMIRFTYGSVL